MKTFCQLLLISLLCATSWAKTDIFENQYEEFLRNIQKEVEKAWNPSEIGEVVFSFEVSAKYGALLPDSVKIQKASSKQIEDETLKALKEAAQLFKPLELPAGRKDEVEIQLNLKAE